MSIVNRGKDRRVARIPTNAGMFLIVGLLLHAMTAIAGETVAVITDLQGEATIDVDGSPGPAEILANLSSGVELQLQDNAKLTLVYFKSGKEYVYTGPASIRIDTGQPKTMSGAKGKSRELAIVKETGLTPSAGSMRQAAIVLRGFKQKKIQLVSPKNTSILKTHPTFTWKSPEAGVQYRFVILDEAGKTIVETLINGTSFKTPPEITFLDNVYYTWQVEARLASGSVYSSSADFKVLVKAERDRLNRLRPAKNSLFAERVLYAAALEQLGLRKDARSYWRTLAAERPGAAVLKARAK